MVVYVGNSGNEVVPYFNPVIIFIFFLLVIYVLLADTEKHFIVCCGTTFS